ncbi:MAG: carboxypeptidase regulatory-like domain-containing protein [Kouleothrix sp.]|nr:carboxypeptidase regulatory-like domain-containing protein [Kouleothrix sp.]
MAILTRLRHVPATLICLALAALLASCGGPDIPLNGTVIDAYTGRPVAAATISLGRSQLTTDTSGKYQVASWSQKDTLQIAASGYEPLHIALDQQPQLAKPTPPAATLDAALRPNTVSGVVTDAYTNQPLGGALVKASETLSATTTADGRYSIAGVPESFTLTIAAGDYEAASQSLKKTIAFDAALRPNVLSGTITDAYSGQPLAGAAVKVGDALAVTTGPDGKYRLEGVPKEATVVISADGYAALTQPIEKMTTIDAVLRPDVLRGALADAKTGAPIKNATVIATPTADTDSVAFTRIDSSADGSFKLEGVPEQGFIQVLAPGYRKATVEIKPGSVPSTIKLEPFTSKALYITAAVASNPRLVTKFFDTIDRTELTAIVIDLKSDLRDDLGLIYYDSQVPIVKELGTAQPIMDIRAILAEAKKRGIYTIARVHIFSHDNVLADARPEWAAKDRKTGAVFADYPGPNIRYAWLDPWNRNVWDYNIQLSVEAAHLGFDEINFDYIRFPSLEFATDDKDRIQLSKPDATPEEMFANITEMLRQSQRAINGAGAFLSVDVFGVTTMEPTPLIGQDIGRMSQVTDYICPMVYPSHYWPGALGYDNPAKHPYEIILDSLQQGEKQVVANRALLRPWLQDFTLVWVPKDQIVEYGPAEVRAQIKAAEDFGKAAGWILYDSDNSYTVEALNPK